MNYSHLDALDFWFKLKGHRTSLQAFPRDFVIVSRQVPNSGIVTKKCSFWEAGSFSPLIYKGEIMKKYVQIFLKRLVWVKTPPVFFCLRFSAKISKPKHS